MKLRDLIQVEVVRHDLAFMNLAQFDKLHVDIADVREIFFENLHGNLRHFLKPLKNIESAPAAVALQRIGRIGDQLQFSQNKLRNRQSAINKAGFGDIGDAAVDDDAGVEDVKLRVGGWAVTTAGEAPTPKLQRIAASAAQSQTPDNPPSNQKRNLHERNGCRSRPARRS